jgi:hypothetical protein
VPAAAGDVGFDVHVRRGRDLPFEPRPDFEIPASLHGRREASRGG